MSSWIDTREVQSEKANLQILFDKYVPVCLDVLRVRFKKITPIPDITQVTTLCYLLECLMTPDNTPPDCHKELYELYFVFAAVWAFGGAMFQDQVFTRPQIPCRDHLNAHIHTAYFFSLESNILISIIYTAIYSHAVSS